MGGIVILYSLGSSFPFEIIFSPPDAFKNRKIDATTNKINETTKAILFFIKLPFKKKRLHQIKIDTAGND